MLADVLLLQGPPRLDGIEVRRVRRLIEETYAARDARRFDPRVVMRAEVIHDEDVAASEPWEKLLLEPSYEAITIGGLPLSNEDHPTSSANRPQQRERLAPIHRN